MGFPEILEKIIQLSKKNVLTDISVEPFTRLESFLNSITYIQFIIACEDTFEIEIDDDELDMSNFETIQDVAVYIEKCVKSHE